MTLHAITVPKWGLSMEEGTVLKWLVQEGTTIAPRDELLEIETSKIVNTVEANVDGIVRRIVAPPGQLLLVGALLAVVSDNNDDDDSITEFIAQHATTKSRSTPKDGRAPELLELRGEPVRFRRLGEGARTPLILIHGFGGDLETWMFNAPALARDRITYLFDLFGHGQSSKQVGEGTLETLALQVIDFIAAMNLTSVHLVGHSMGAGIAMTVGAQSSDFVRSITTICGVGFSGAINREFLEGFIGAQRRKELKPILEMLFARSSLVTRQMVEDVLSYKRIDGVEQALRQIANGALSEAGLATLSLRRQQTRLPLLALFGNKDQIIWRPDLSGISGEVIEGTGHMTHMEAADVVNDRISHFLRNND